MEITPEQFARTGHYLPRQCGNVSVTNLQVVNSHVSQACEVEPTIKTTETLPKALGQVQLLIAGNGLL